MDTTLLPNPLIVSFAQQRDKLDAESPEGQRWQDFDMPTRVSIAQQHAARWVQSNPDNKIVQTLAADFVRRVQNPPERPAPGFLNDVGRAVENSNDMAASLAVPFEDKRRIWTQEYEDNLLHGRPTEPGLAAGLVGGLSAPLAVGAGTSAVATPIGGLAAGATVGGAIAQGQSTKNNYFALLDKGVDPDEAWNKAHNIGAVSGALTAAANIIPGEAVVAKVAPDLAKKLATSTLSGAARFARDTAVAGGVNAGQNVVGEVLDIGQERLQGSDSSAYSGTAGQRVGNAAALGFGLTAATRVGSKAKDFATGEGFTAENDAGLVGSLLSLHDAQRKGDTAAVQKLSKIIFSDSTDVAADKAAMERMLDSVTLGRSGLDWRVTDKNSTVDKDELARVVGKEVTLYRRALQADTTGQLATVLHEAGHPLLDMLPDNVRQSAFDLFHAEMSSGKSPLLETSKTDKGVAIGTRDGVDAQIMEFWNQAQNKNTAPDARAAALNRSFREWFSERMTAANLDWIEGRAATKSDSFFGALSNDVKTRLELFSRSLGFGDALNNKLRNLIDNNGATDMTPTLPLVRERMGLPATPAVKAAGKGKLVGVAPAGADKKDFVAPEELANLAKKEAAAYPTAQTDAGINEPVASGGMGALDFLKTSQALDKAGQKRTSQQTVVLGGEPTRDVTLTPDVKPGRITTGDTMTDLSRTMAELEAQAKDKSRTLGERVDASIQLQKLRDTVTTGSTITPVTRNVREVAPDTFDPNASARELVRRNYPIGENKPVQTQETRVQTQKIPVEFADNPIRQDIPIEAKLAERKSRKPVAEKPARATPEAVDKSVNKSPTESDKLIAKGELSYDEKLKLLDSLKQEVEPQLDRLRKGYNDLEDLGEASRRTKKVSEPVTKTLENENDLTYKNGWLSPNGHFHPTEVTDAVAFKTGDYGNHAKGALELINNDPRYEAAFQSELEMEGKKRPSESDIYDFMFRQGFVRVADGGTVQFVEGKPSKKQMEMLQLHASALIKHDAPLLTKVVDGYVPSSLIREQLGQDEGWLSKRKPGERQFAARAGEAIPELETIRQARPDIKDYAPQTIDDGAASAQLKSDKDLDTSVARLRSKVESNTEKNFLVLDGLERMRRALDAGDTKAAESVYATLSKVGTTLGQLLRQFAEFKSPKTVANQMTVIELGLKQKGLRLQPHQTTKLRDLLTADGLARTDYENAVQAALNHPSEAAYTKADAAERMTHRTTRDWARYLATLSPRDSVPRDLLAVIQGNLLTPKSSLRNFWGNYVSGIPRLAAREIGAMRDFIHAKAFGTERTTAAVSTREAAWFARATRDALPGTLDMLYRGTSTTDIAGEHIQGFHPVKALQAVFNGDLPVDIDTGKVPARVTASKLFEAIMGAAPEPMLRSLAAFDEMAKAGARASRLAQETKTRGLVEGTREFAAARVAATDEYKRLAMDTALESTFQQDSAPSRMFMSAEGTVRNVAGDAGVLALRILTSPYVKTPVNVAVETVSYAVPAVAAMQFASRTYHGDRRGANLAFGKFWVGLTLGAIADYLMDDGLVSGGVPDDNTQRQLQSSTDMGYYRINVDGLKRKMAGGSGAFQSGDTTYRLDILGVPGIVLGVRADMARLAPHIKNRVPTAGEQTMNTDVLGQVVGMGRFMVNSTMMENVGNGLEALTRGDFSHYMRNVFQQVASVRPDWANTVTAVQTAGQTTKPNINDQSIPVTWQNVVKFKNNEWNDLPVKLDIWGRPMKATPEGQNPYVFHLLDIRQPQKGQADATTVIETTFNATKDTRVIPAWPGRNLPVRDLPAGLYLPAKLYQSYVAEVQGAKLKQFETMLGEQWFARATPEQQVKMLDRGYSRAGEAASMRWRSEHRGELDKLTTDLKAYLAKPR